MHKMGPGLSQASTCAHCRSAFLQQADSLRTLKLIPSSTLESADIYHIKSFGGQGDRPHRTWHSSALRQPTNTKSPPDAPLAIQNKRQQMTILAAIVKFTRSNALGCPISLKEEAKGWRIHWSSPVVELSRTGLRHIERTKTAMQ